MRRVRSTIITAVLAALVVFVLLLPWSGNDSDPPECFSVLGYVVPCGPGPEQQQGQGFALAGAVVAAVLVGAGSAVGRREAIQD
jgi:drug/metabolite transporter (DMT)-like permease